MAPSVAQLPKRVEGKPLKYGEGRTQETFVRGGELFEKAANALGYSQEQTAEHYGVSPSLLSRQITNQDKQHLSFNRICEMPPVFREKLALEMLADASGGEVETLIRLRRVGP